MRMPLAACLLLALAACSDKPPEPQAQAASPSRHAATPWDGLKKDEQRAKDVQKTVDDQAARQRKALEAAGG